MRTRCPTCATVFRVTSAQLRAKAGKVRCGQCHGLFNAFDSLLPETPEAPPALEETRQAVTAVDSVPVLPVAETPAPPEESAASSAPPEDQSQDSCSAEAPALALEETHAFADAVAAEQEPAAAPLVSPPELPTEAATAPAPAEQPEPPAEASDESIEESTLAAREAGLVAARELAETPAYNRWAAGTLTGASLGGFEPVSARPARWPFVLASVVLVLTLAAQLLYHFRTEAVLRLPVVASLFEALAIAVPLPSHAELVSIEASDLQSDNARGLLVLQATLKNRAAYAQAWPALELALTDAQDTVLARRVIAANDYLPTDADRERFAANGETAVRLWIEARELKASGYRLYIFYP